MADWTKSGWLVRIPASYLSSPIPSALKSKEPRVVEKTQGMIKWGNCENAYDFLITTYPELKIPSRDESYDKIPYPVLYYAGVSCECVASKQAPSLDKIRPWLEKADIFYSKASMRATGDKHKHIQQAAKDLSYAMDLLSKPSRKLASTKRLATWQRS